MKSFRHLLNGVNFIRLASCATAVFLMGTAARSFEGKLAGDLALVAGSPEESISLLKLSVSRNPDDAQTILDLADALVKSGDSAAALGVLKTSCIGANHWQGWQRQGKIWKERAKGPAGTADDAKTAAAIFEKVNRVHPYYSPSLEYRGDLALQLREWDNVAAITDQLEQIDFNNLGANYLRAQLAAKLGETTKALTFSKRLSDQKGYPSALFTKQQIHQQIEALQSELKP